MYIVSKRMEIAGAHKLDLPYESKCRNVHGHNWIVVVECCSNRLDHHGMVVDFKKVKNAIHGELDHSYINDKMGLLNPTAENMAHWICDKVSDLCKDDHEDIDGAYCTCVTVQESEGNVAKYINPRWLASGGTVE